MNNNKQPRIPPTSEPLDNDDELEFELNEQAIDPVKGDDAAFRVLSELDLADDMAIDEDLEREVSQWLVDPELSKLSSAPKPERSPEVPTPADSPDDWDDILHDFAADVAPTKERRSTQETPKREFPGQVSRSDGEAGKRRKLSPARKDNPPPASAGSADTSQNLSPSALTDVSPKVAENPKRAGSKAETTSADSPDASVGAKGQSSSRRTGASQVSGDHGTGNTPAGKKPLRDTAESSPKRNEVKPRELPAAKSEKRVIRTTTSRVDSAAGLTLDQLVKDASDGLDSPTGISSRDLVDDLGYDVVSGPVADLSPSVVALAPIVTANRTPNWLQVTVRIWQRWAVWKKALAVALPVVGLLWISSLLYQWSVQSDEPPAYPPPAKRSVVPATVSRPDETALSSSSVATTTAAPVVARNNDSPPLVAVPVAELGIAYGTEKRSWLEWAAREFSTTAAGQRIRIRLIPFGSLESAHAILDGDQRIHVWAPASSLYRESLLRDWEAKYGGNPLLKEEPLALTPMVIVMWKKRYEAFTVKSPEVSLRMICFAMRAPRGWETIAAKPAWGRFKFSYTHPNQSNSGLMTLVVLAYEFFGKTSGLTVADVMSPKFQDHLAAFAKGVSTVSNSTGNMMREMTLKGPTNCDAAVVYESVAIEYLDRAEGRWDRLQVVYPRQNLWNDNPYCILNTKWTTPDIQQAAEIFLKFLLSEPAQLKALDFGFRPANAAVSIKGPQSPFTKYVDHGVSIDLPEICEVPSRDVMENLLQAWVRNSDTDG